jgi:hypothetical protein
MLNVHLATWHFVHFYNYPELVGGCNN